MSLKHSSNKKSYCNEKCSNSNYDRNSDAARVKNKIKIKDWRLTNQKNMASHQKRGVSPHKRVVTTLNNKTTVYFFNHHPNTIETYA
jgi:hypothetical protein